MSKGFTLIELLITIMLMSMIAVVGTQTFVSLMRANTKAEILKEIRQTGDYALVSMERTIRGAADITSACDGSAVDALVITTAAGETITYGCVIDDVTDIPKIASTSATTGYLTSDKVSLNIADPPDTSCPGSLTFTCSQPVGAPKIITISFSLRQAAATQFKPEQASVPFSTTITVRNQ